MKLRPLAIGLSSVAILATSMVGFASPASAAADVTFTPTTGLVPGSALSNVVVTTSGGPLCQYDNGTEPSNGHEINFGVDFFDSADQTYSVDDSFLGSALGPSVLYVPGSTSSDSFTISVPLLNRHDSANYIVAVGSCTEYEGGDVVRHGDGVVISYSDLTLVTPNAAQGSTATAHIVDNTDNAQFCDSYNETGPFSVGLEFYSSFASYDNGDDPVVMLPTGWSQGSGAGLGSFAGNALNSGVDIDFVVPSDLPVGEYQVYAFCIAGDGRSAGDAMGLQPFTVTAPALPSTGLDTMTIAGLASGASALIALGTVAFVIRRRATKA